MCITLYIRFWKIELYKLKFRIVYGLAELLFTIKMKTIISSAKLSVCLFVMLLGLTISTAFSQDSKPFSINESPLPAATAPVNDFAGVLDESTKSRINQRLIEFRDKTNPSVELAVAIVKTTAERPIFDFSLAVARGWKIGSKEDDNPSALLLVAIDDRKYFTQISKDLEDELPDGLAGQLQRQYLVPAFKQGDYGKGISDTIEAYIRTIEQRGSGTPAATGNTQKPERSRARGGGLGGICNFVTCLIILFVLMIIIFSRSGRGGGGRGGGGIGGGGGGFGSALPWIILGSGLGRGGGGSSSDWGGSSGGGDSWGGFGGGGDFGGGGAGGDW